MESISIGETCSYVCVIQGCDVNLTRTHSSNERHMTNTHRRPRAQSSVGATDRTPEFPSKTDFTTTSPDPYLRRTTPDYFDRPPFPTFFYL